MKTTLLITLGASLAAARPGCPSSTRSSTTTTTTTAPPETTPAPSECAITTTHTWYGNKSSGCPFDPSGDFCVLDTILTLPCGCTKASNLVQRTTTVCASTDKAMNCWTGFMFTTTATACY